MVTMVYHGQHGFWLPNTNYYGQPSNTIKNRGLRPWYTMVTMVYHGHHGIPWSMLSMVNHGLHGFWWLNTNYHGQPSNTIKNRGMNHGVPWSWPWYTMVKVWRSFWPWLTRVWTTIWPWSTMVSIAYHGLPWYKLLTMVYHSQPFIQSVTRFYNCHNYNSEFSDCLY